MAQPTEKLLKHLGLILLMLLQSTCKIQAAGPLCYECDHMPHQRDCGKIVQCGDHEECFGRQMVTTDARIFYKSGCKASSTCIAGRKRDDKTLCEACCNSDFCNLQTCDTPVALGHRCLACDNVVHPSDCNLVKQCDVDEICYTEEIYNVNSEKRFRLGCARESSCRSVPLLTAPAIGKRQSLSERQTSNLPLSTSYCAKCCRTENCNRDLCVPGGLTGVELLSPPSLLLCFDYDEVACRQLIGTDPAPCFQTKIKNLLCPRTCGTCSGGGVRPGGTVSTPQSTVSTGGGITTPTATTGDTCSDFGDRCMMDPSVKQIVCSTKPDLCLKSCGLCSGGVSSPQSTVSAATCRDPISECQCRYLDEQVNICEDTDDDVKMFCCFFCNKKHRTYTCPNPQCRKIEQQEFDRIKHLGINSTCHSDIH